MQAMRKIADRAGDHADAGARWLRLHIQAEQIAELASISAEKPMPSADSLEQHLADAHDWQRDLVIRGLDDMEALTGLGLQALSTLVERQAPTQAPALALWREFHEARSAIIEILTPHDKAA